MTIEVANKVKKKNNRRKPKGDSQEVRGVPQEGSSSKPKGGRSKADLSKKRNDTSENGQKFLQLGKLIRSYKPVTVNGIPSGKIAESVKARELKRSTESVSETEPVATEMNARDKLKYIKQYLLEFIQKQPDSAIHLSFVVKPSDPDFPYDLEDLKISLSIPSQYPYDNKVLPSIVVLNEEIPRGFAINLEQGFKRICKVALTNAVDEDINLDSKKSLVAQVEALDRYLELFLKQEKRQTIKIVMANKKSPSPAPEKSQSQRAQRQTPVKESVEPVRINVSRDILKRRNQMIDHLMNRFGSNVKLFKKSDVENRYKVTLPVQPQQANIPELWSLNKSVDIMIGVPVNYPESGLTFSFPNNFNTNLILKYKNNGDSTAGASKDGPQKMLLEYTRDYKTIEKNLLANLSKDHKFGNNTELVGVINWITNNLGVFCDGESAYSQWQSNLNKFLKVI